MSIIRVVVMAGVFAFANISAASSATAANFDGHWSLIAQTTNGHCGITRWDFTIGSGRLHYPGGYLMGYPVGLGGAVSRSGQVRVKVVAGPRVANGAGRLSKVRGSGTWAGQGPSGRCSGIWTATRVQGGAHQVSMTAPYPMWFWRPHR